MARNIEVKACIANMADVESKARAIATDGPTDMAQDDTFFACAAGRLKLRELAPNKGQLIFYARPDVTGPKTSDYWISDTDSPATLREVLRRSLGVVGRVRKNRRLFLVGRTRIHLDQVEGLGSFVEVETVLADNEPPTSGQEVTSQILRSLGISESCFVSGAYVDLLRQDSEDRKVSGTSPQL